MKMIHKIMPTRNVVIVGLGQLTSLNVVEVFDAVCHC